MNESLSAEECKLRANQLFQEKHYDRAIDYYTRAIELDGSIAALYANRALAYLKTECYGLALADADKAIELDPGYVKAYYRRAMAYMPLGNYHKFVQDLRRVCQMAPNDVDAKRNLQECQKIVKKIDFEKAIAVDDAHYSSKGRVLHTLNVEDMIVDNSYKGPILENGEVTMSFIREMTEAFKMQKSLHKKYVYQVGKSSEPRTDHLYRWIIHFTNEIRFIDPTEDCINPQYTTITCRYRIFGKFQIYYLWRCTWSIL